MVTVKGQTKAEALEWKNKRKRFLELSTAIPDRRLNKRERDQYQSLRLWFENWHNR